ncbi:MAG: hypothetical protein ACRDRS_13255 [Pseudonocardiaceae bacterium]
MTDGVEILRRQIHPKFLDRGQPSGQAFRPTMKDAGCLSTRREAMSAKDACEAHLAEGFASAGTWGVSVSAVNEAGCRAVDDSQVAGAPDHHVYIDFRHQSGKQIERSAKAFKRNAIERGCLYEGVPASTS